MHDRPGDVQGRPKGLRRPSKDLRRFSERVPGPCSTFQRPTRAFLDLASSPKAFQGFPGLARGIPRLDVLGPSRGVPGRRTGLPRPSKSLLRLFKDVPGPCKTFQRPPRAVLDLPKTFQGLTRACHGLPGRRGTSTGLPRPARGCQGRSRTFHGASKDAQTPPRDLPRSFQGHPRAFQNLARSSRAWQGPYKGGLGHATGQGLPRACQDLNGPPEAFRGFPRACQAFSKSFQEISWVSRDLAKASERLPRALQDRVMVSNASRTAAKVSTSCQGLPPHTASDAAPRAAPTKLRASQAATLQLCASFRGSAFHASRVWGRCSSPNTPS